MTKEIKKVSISAKWNFVSARINAIQNGRFDLEVHLAEKGGN